jgi:biotin carboxylase
MKVAVLGAGGPAGVNWCRALAEADHEVWAVDADRTHLTWAKPWCDEVVHAPALSSELVNSFGCDVVHAAPDTLVRWLAERRDEITAAVLLPALATIERCQYKPLAVAAWERAELRSGAMPVDLDAISDWLNFAKDAYGLPFWLRATEGAGAKGATLVEDLRTGYHWLRYWQTRGLNASWMCEEYFPGRDYAWTGIYLHGELVTSFARERLEYIYPGLSPSGLTGTPVRAAVVHDDRVNEVAEHAVAAVDQNPTGIFAVDLREDVYGMPRPTEINAGRGGTTTGLWSVATGANFAHLAARLATGDWSALERWASLKRNALPEGLELRRHVDCGEHFINERVAA